jgi:hypothetical protein
MGENEADDKPDKTERCNLQERHEFGAIAFHGRLWRLPVLTMYLKQESCAISSVQQDTRPGNEGKVALRIGVGCSVGMGRISAKASGSGKIARERDERASL